MGGASTRVRGVLVATSLAFGLHAGGAAAADATEVWPEAAFFFGIGERTRLGLDAAYAQGKDSDTESLDLSVFMDNSVVPILRKELRSADWQRSRYVWSRIGYTHVGKAAGGSRGEDENRGIVSLHARFAIPAEIWLESRIRADLRWIGSDYSTRYRYRIDASREFTMRRRPLVAYLNYEWFYDSRYDDLARTLAMLGVELTVSERFRFEMFLARQVDRQPAVETLDAAGLVFKWYF
jgi:hypothetical protein